MTAGRRARLAAARRAATVVLAAAAWWTVSCRDIPAPADGVYALSPVHLPSPGVVAGDTMRDSLGLAAPLRVTAFRADGEPLDPQPAVRFVVLDSGARLADALLLGEQAGRSVRVVGGAGAIQTRPAVVPVTLRPDTLSAADSTRHRKSYSLLTGDTVVNSAPLAAVVRHLGPPSGTVEAVVVHYRLDRVPAGNGQGPTVVLVEGNARTARDTSDAGGRVARTARLRLSALSTFATDTVEITAHASYRGRPLGAVTYTVVFTNQ